jgi:tungstate transport system substrate-binding protein
MPTGRVERWRALVVLCTVLIFGAGCRPDLRPENRLEILLATTTSTQDSGLLDVLVPLFEARSGYRVKTIAVGTGQALALGARGEADVVLAHAPEAEKRWMEEGHGAERLLVMHNDFVIVGPAADPANIRGEQSATAALGKVVSSGASWVSRDDNSGTDQLEKRLWEDSGTNPKGEPGHLISGQGMGATLTLADQKQAYTLADRATYLGRANSLALGIMVEGDRRLLNVYHVMPVSSQKFPNVNREGGQAFAHFLVSDDGQRAIGAFGREKYGQVLFSPDAGKAEDELTP